jgi:NAD(P)-dependent dehydrogenase (short-subunit alcohol dehydrogenase family)|tara:strand:- start:13741 stop:14505 length:765 start_codon:yes stop_codon:yes gene_type:complete
MLLNDKTILVVGAGGLLGQKIVESAINEGARVVAADISHKALEPLKGKFSGQQLATASIDITDTKSIHNAFEFSEETWSGLDGAVNTAYPKNKNYGRKFFDVTFEDFSENLSSHLGGYFVFMQQCAAYSKSVNRAFSLVNLSSVYGVIAPRFEVYENTNMTTPVEYAAIKSALLQLGRYATAYMKGTDFRVNSVSPGGLWADQEESFLEKYRSHCSKKGMLNPEDITGAINFLLSDQSSYVCGQNIVVDDGFTI